MLPQCNATSAENCAKASSVRQNRQKYQKNSMFFSIPDQSVANKLFFELRSTLYIFFKLLYLMKFFVGFMKYGNNLMRNRSNFMRIIGEKKTC